MTVQRWLALVALGLVSCLVGLIVSLWWLPLGIGLLAFPWALRELWWLRKMRRALEVILRECEAAEGRRRQ